ncbi:MAG: hypothetical protein ABGY42_04935 [bacterium]
MNRTTMMLRFILSLLIACVLPALAGAETAASSAAQARNALVAAAEVQVEIGLALNDAEIVAASRRSIALWGRASDENLHHIPGLHDDTTATLVRLEWQAERLRGLRDSLRTSRESTRRDADSSWPVAECSLGSESGLSWAGYMDAVYATDAAMTTLRLASVNCEQIIIEPIEIVDPFVFGNPVTCAGVIAGSIIPVPPFVECVMDAEGFPAGEGMVVEGGAKGEVPGLSEGACLAAAESVAALAKVQELLKTDLACWSSGRAKANYERLDYIHEEVEEMENFVATIRRLLFEHALSVRGGSRAAFAYLPAERDGYLDETRQTVETAIEETSVVGYRMKAGIPRTMQDADDYRAAGDVKRAFDRYRKAFRQATRSSRQLNETRTKSGRGTP